MLCAKPCGKRLLLSPEKSSEGTLYSVPSFGGHIAISHDVTVYPFLVMARTDDYHVISQHVFSSNTNPTWLVIVMLVWTGPNTQTNYDIIKE